MDPQVTTLAISLAIAAGLAITCKLMYDRGFTAGRGFLAPLTRENEKESSDEEDLVITDDAGPMHELPDIIISHENKFK